MADYRESEEIFDRLAASDAFARFRSAFEAATGMGLEIHSADSDFSAGQSSLVNPFCRILNQYNRCPECAAAAHCVVKEVEEKPKAFACFAGMTESAVPILAGQVPVAYLTTGQVFTRDVKEEEWDEICLRLDEMDYSEEEIGRLKGAWKETKNIGKEQYEGMVTLLSVFAGSLSEQADRIILEQRDSEPEAVVEARRYVNAHLADTIDLDEVARHVGMSTSHFCKVFKSSTGLTFNQYVTRRRVEWAKCRLRKPHSRVTEIAYDVGFGSLSQFNRSFQKLAGISPTEWRQRERMKFAGA